MRNRLSCEKEILYTGPECPIRVVYASVGSGLIPVDVAEVAGGGFDGKDKPILEGSWAEVVRGVVVVVEEEEEEELLLLKGKMARLGIDGAGTDISAAGIAETDSLLVSKCCLRFQTRMAESPNPAATMLASSVIAIVVRPSYVLQKVNMATEGKAAADKATRPLISLKY